ncbi:quaternary ammonium compound-resistance protein SugE [Marininema mesophilum]|uniref:Quaternary ammonium compound-resistance protein SugE n=1 Tax=Marininema mesophilum TaxID=1048340 RepID=A0A1H3A1W3_9BACL|nr:quaternary ammonium compound efflux SMR transporter SugE [Marininema mesophilum]SDX23154.1 quaternary ammonium compound-resistance protein SugE [Marininema mesophilum]
MSWIYLIVAGLFEIVWAIGLKYTQGFSKPLPSLITLVAMTISLILLSLSLKTLPIGTAYAVWTGIGILGTIIVGMIAFGESRDVLRILFLSLIVVSILGLKVTTPE